MDEEKVTLDNWRPEPKADSPYRLPSNWRKKANDKSKYKALPSADEESKIKCYIKHGFTDEEVKDIFNISDKSLAKIKRDIKNKKRSGYDGDEI